MKLGDETTESLELSKLWGIVSSSVLETDRDQEDGVDETILSIKILQSPQIDPSSSHSHN